MVTENILRRVFLIKSKNNTGSCFLISLENNDYLITARHLFNESINSSSPTAIEIFKDNKWINCNTKLLIHENPKIDVAVLDLCSNNFKTNDFEIEDKNYFLSQDCYFIGFPFGLKMEDANKMKINDGYPIPFVKKGIISSFTPKKESVRQIFIDGHNNPGFSGGPVVIRDVDEPNDMRVIGIVSAYLTGKNVIDTPFGSLTMEENSGIVLSYGMRHVFEIIKKYRH